MIKVENLTKRYAGTTAINGVFTTDPDCADVTLIVLVAIWVRVPPGNAPPLFVYSRTVTDWLLLVEFTPKETEFTKYWPPPTKLPMLNALQ